jgi:hypothetical protein
MRPEICLFNIFSISVRCRAHLRGSTFKAGCTPLDDALVHKSHEAGCDNINVILGSSIHKRFNLQHYRGISRWTSIIGATQRHLDPPSVFHTHKQWRVPSTPFNTPPQPPNPTILPRSACPISNFLQLTWRNREPRARRSAQQVRSSKQSWVGEGTCHAIPESALPREL